MSESARLPAGRTPPCGDAAGYLAGRTNVQGSTFQFERMATVLVPPLLRPAPFQAAEAIELVLGVDALGMRFREVKLGRDPKCPLCGEHPTITDLSIHRSGADASR